MSKSHHTSQVSIDRFSTNDSTTGNFIQQNETDVVVQLTANVLLYGPDLDIYQFPQGFVFYPFSNSPFTELSGIIPVHQCSVCKARYIKGCSICTDFNDHSAFQRTRYLEHTIQYNLCVVLDTTINYRAYNLKPIYEHLFDAVRQILTSEPQTTLTLMLINDSVNVFCQEGDSVYINSYAARDMDDFFLNREIPEQILIQSPLQYFNTCFCAEFVEQFYNGQSEYAKSYNCFNTAMLFFVNKISGNAQVRSTLLAVLASSTGVGFAAGGVGSGSTINKDIVNAFYYDSVISRIQFNFIFVDEQEEMMNYFNLSKESGGQCFMVDILPDDEDNSHITCCREQINQFLYNYMNRVLNFRVAFLCNENVKHQFVGVGFNDHAGGCHKIYQTHSGYELGMILQVHHMVSRCQLQFEYEVGQSHHEKVYNFIVRGTCYIAQLFVQNIKLTLSLLLKEVAHHVVMDDLARYFNTISAQIIQYETQKPRQANINVQNLLFYIYFILSGNIFGHSYYTRYKQYDFILNSDFQTLCIQIARPCYHIGANLTVTQCISPPCSLQFGTAVILESFCGDRVYVLVNDLDSVVLGTYEHYDSPIDPRRTQLVDRLTQKAKEIVSEHYEIETLRNKSYVWLYKSQQGEMITEILEGAPKFDDWKQMLQKRYSCYNR